MATEGSPKIWDKFTVVKNGETINITLQQVTPELTEPVIDHMCEFFLTGEPCTSYSKLSKDPVSLEQVRDLWRKGIKTGASVVAVQENGSNRPPFNIVGCNITAISRKNEDQTLQFKGEAFTALLRTVMAQTKEGNLYEKYGVDEYLTAYGLSVHSDYHGLGLGLKLLQARRNICKDFGLKMTATVFTAPTSQYLARKAGFHLVTEREYKEFDVDGKIYFPNLEGKTCLMALVYDS